MSKKSEFVQVAGVWHALEYDGQHTLCGIALEFFVSGPHRVSGICITETIPDLACIDCAIEGNYDEHPLPRQIGSLHFG